MIRNGVALVVLVFLGISNAVSACDKHKKKTEASTETQVQSQSQAEKGNSAIKNDNDKTTAAQPTELDAKQQTQSAVTDLKVVEFVLASQLEGREPRNVVDNFTKENERGFAFARLNVPESTEVTFVWIRNDHQHSRVTMPVHKAKTWRTYSSVKLKPGNWKVQLVANNQVLAEKTFTQE